jgi:predicted ATPase
MERIIRVALTGGPGGGKTTILQRCAELGHIGRYRVFAMAEAASSLKLESGSEGKKFKSADLVFQRLVLERQFAVEEAVLRYARLLAVPAIILMDRGMFDSAGFISPSEYESLLREMSLTASDALARYDSIIFLRSADADSILGGSRFSIPSVDAFRAHIRSVETAIEQHITAHPRVTFVHAQPTIEGKSIEVLSALEKVCLFASIGIP